MFIKANEEIIFPIEPFLFFVQVFHFYHLVFAGIRAKTRHITSQPGAPARKPNTTQNREN